MNKSLLILNIIFLASLLFSAAWGETDVERCNDAYKMKDYVTAFPVCLTAADQGDAGAQIFIGIMYGLGEGVKQDSTEAALWLRKSTELGGAETRQMAAAMNRQFILPSLANNFGMSPALYELARRYNIGDGVEKNHQQAEKLLLRSIFRDNKNKMSADLLENDFDWHCIEDENSSCIGLINKSSIKKNNVLSWYWLLSPINYNFKANQQKSNILIIVRKFYNVMNCNNKTVGFKTFKMLNEGLEASETFQDENLKDNEIEFKPLEPGVYSNSLFDYVCSSTNAAKKYVEANEIYFGTGWPIKEGYIVTNQHVVNGKKKITVVTSFGEKISATLLIEDKINDLALLKVSHPEKLPPALSIAKSTAKAGTKVFTIGYPHPDSMGANAKLTEGIVNADTGYMDDPRTLQISVPVQSGNSGGPLLNMNGEVIGIVTAKLSAVKMFNWTGDLPQNVNYAVKSPYITALLSSVNNQTNKIKLLPIKPARLESLSSKIKNSILMVIAE